MRLKILKLCFSSYNSDNFLGRLDILLDIKRRNSRILGFFKPQEYNISDFHLNFIITRPLYVNYFT